MELQLRDSSTEVALRNEEVNRQRLQANRNSNGPLKVTDPAAFAKLMADMKEKAELQKKLEAEREAERARREGSNYKTPEERSRESKDSKAKLKAIEETKAIDDSKFDPSKDYYAILGVDRSASAAQIKARYKRLALLYHPDKHKAENSDEQAAIEAKFREVAAAFDLLLDEEQRALYDKCRDYMDANPGKGLPPLSPEEAARMASGAAELRKLRRMGPKLAKHAPLHREVEVSLQKLNTGCTRAVAVERRRVDYSGQEFISNKTFHLVIRKGSREGDRLIFEGDGNETVDTEAGDLIFTLRASSHPVFRRKGDKDLEVFAAAVPAEDFLCATEVQTLSGGKRVVVVPALRAAMEGGGVGGVWHAVLPKLGLFDAKEPWDAPPGDMHVHLRYPAVLLKERTVISHLHPGPVYLLGSSNDMVSAALAAGMVAAKLRHLSEARHMQRDNYGPLPATQIVSISIKMDTGTRSRGNSISSSSLSALQTVLRSRVPSSRLTSASLRLPSGILEDTAWAALHTADAILLDLKIPEPENVSKSPEELSMFREKCLADLFKFLEESGILHLLWERHWCGAAIIACGQACSVLGRMGKEKKYHSVLPWYAVRAGGAAGWQDVCLAASGASTTAVGVLATSCYCVDHVSGRAELVVAPCREALMERAAWEGPLGEAADATYEAEEDYGYFAAFISA